MQINNIKITDFKCLGVDGAKSIARLRIWLNEMQKLLTPELSSSLVTKVMDIPEIRQAIESTNFTIKDLLEQSKATTDHKIRDELVAEANEMQKKQNVVILNAAYQNPELMKEIFGVNMEKVEQDIELKDKLDDLEFGIIKYFLLSQKFESNLVDFTTKNQRLEIIQKITEEKENILDQSFTQSIQNIRNWLENKKNTNEKELLKSQPN